MTGLDKIVSEILEEAKSEAEAVVKKAQDEADEILAAAKAAGDAQSGKIAEGAKADVADIERGRASALALQRRQRTLQTKQALLAETLKKARESIYEFPADTYFPLLVRLAAASAEKGEGAMLLNQKDLARLPEGFEKKLNEALPEGKALKISGESRPIDGGFVLKYGDVEENCSFAAIFEARKEEFTDRIKDILFA